MNEKTQAKPKSQTVEASSAVFVSPLQLSSKKFLTSTTQTIIKLKSQNSSLVTVPSFSQQPNRAIRTIPKFKIFQVTTRKFSQQPNRSKGTIPTFKIQKFQPGYYLQIFSATTEQKKSSKSSKFKISAWLLLGNFLSNQTRNRNTNALNFEKYQAN